VGKAPIGRETPYMKINYFVFTAIHQILSQPIKYFCMSASSGKRKVKNLRISKVSLPSAPSLARKRKFSNLTQTPVQMDKLETEKKLCIGKVIYLPNPVKSQNDKKEYRSV
jgi:hypothetical protein